MSHWWFIDPSFLWHRRRHRHGRNTYVLFVINEAKVVLKPNENIFALTDIPLVGKGLDMSIAFLDDDGDPVDWPAIPDDPPIWRSSSPVTDLSVSVDGLTAHARPVRIGRDTISVEVFIGRTVFAASLIVNVIGVKSRLTSIQLLATPTP